MPLGEVDTAEAILSRSQDGIELAIDPGTYSVTSGAKLLSRNLCWFLRALEGLPKDS